MSKECVKKINLALQGGGSHGAFTWGVLDYLLEDNRLEIDCISGTSAGAMNAVVMADGYCRNGPDGAREKLEIFWKKMSNMSEYSPMQRSLWNMFMGQWSLDNSLSYQMSDFISHSFSPYQLNPFNINPLLSIVEEVVDFEKVRQCNAFQLFISATNVETGRVQIFSKDELRADMVMASACLPFLFKAVEIDGVPYWDGGYMGNPVLFPFHDHSDCHDIMVVQINPIERKGTPKTPQDIQNRINEIAFNSSLLKEFRAINFVARLLDEGKLDADEYARQHIHIIHDDAALQKVGTSSKMNAEWDFLLHLRDLGRKAAQGWLDQNFEHIGKQSTVDLRAMFQGVGSDW